MLIDTKYFGTIEYTKSDLLQFPNGLYGFEEYQNYLLLPFDEENSTMFCLQSKDEPGLAFVVFDPFLLDPSYAPNAEYPAGFAASTDQLAYFVLAVVGEDFQTSTVNLRCPLLINFSTHQGTQLILDELLYSFRYPLFAKEGA